MRTSNQTSLSVLNSVQSDGEHVCNESRRLRSDMVDTVHRAVPGQTRAAICRRKSDVGRTQWQCIRFRD